MTLQWHPAQSGRAGTLVRQTRRHLLAVMAGAATACRLGTRPVAEPQPAQQLTTRELELTYMPWDQARPDLLPTLEQVLQRFTAKYPNLKVTPMPAGGTYIEKLKTLVAAGTPPDVADTHQSQVRDLGPAGIVQDLTPFLKRDPPPKEHTGWEPYQWQGKQYGIPWGLQSSCIFYNKALFNQAGLPYPPDDWTWEQFLEVARRLTKPAPNEAEAQWGAADYGGRNYQYMHALLATFGGGILNEQYTEAIVTSPASLQGLEFRVGWVTTQRVTPLAGALGNLSGMFFEGRLAMQILGSWFISNTKANWRGEQGGWDVAPLPKGPRRRAGLVHENGIGLPAGIRYPAESWALLKHLTSPEGLAPFARVGRIIPANRGVWEAALPPDGQPPRFKRAILDVWDEIAIVPPFVPRQPEAGQIWNEELDPVWRGERAPREGALAFKRRMDALLQELKSQGLL